MALGATIQLFDGATALGSLAGIKAVWWDSPVPDGSPIGVAESVTTDASGWLSLDLSMVSSLDVGGYGFLSLYKMDATNHEDSLVFSGKVQTSSVTSGARARVADNGFSRNKAWLALPDVSGMQKVAGLYRVDNHDCVVALICAGAYVVDWGDGSAPESVASGVLASHSYTYADAGLAGTDSPVTFLAVDDTANMAGHPYVDNDEVRFYNLSGSFGVNEGRSYYVVSASADTFKIAQTKGGTAVSITADGSATLLPYKQAIVTITPQSGENLTLVNFNERYPGRTVAHPATWMDIAVSGQFLSTLEVSALSVQVKFTALEQFSLVGQNAISSFSYMFYGCMKLKSFPELYTGASTRFDHAFRGCNSLLSIPLIDTSLSTTFTYMFHSCGALRRVPRINTAAGSIFTFMFYTCSALKDVALLDLSAGTSFDSMFYGCSSIENIPRFDTSSGTDFGSMFRDCISLSEAPLLDTSLGLDFGSMFYGCSALLSVPALDIGAATSVSNMFYNCPMLSVCDIRNTNLAISYASCNLGSAELNAIYANLPVVTSKTITVTGNHGVSGDDPTIATAKGWTVTGS